MVQSFQIFRRRMAVLLLALALVAPHRAPAQETPPAPPASEAKGVKSVPYIPESVKAELREEIKKEVLATAKQEGWAAPNAVPEWLKRLKPSGEVRFRLESVLFPPGNANGGEFPDWNAINTNKPFDVNFVDVANERYINVDQNRFRPRLRAWLGLDADLGQGFTSGVRIASGDGSTPVSTNQTLGGVPGNFSKYQVWLDRAYLRFQFPAGEWATMMAEVGRFENPFVLIDLLWDTDVNFDGFTYQSRFAPGAAVQPFVTLGVGPLYSTALNFPSELPAKYPSFYRWLFAAQAGVDWTVTPALNLTLAASFSYFMNVQGRVAPSCDTHLKDVTCSTDETRPLFAQKGNTYMALREPSPAALQAEATGLVPRYQYFGLASRFEVLTVLAKLDARLAPRLKLSAVAEYIRNLGFNAAEIAPVALNNLGPIPAGESAGPFQGGGNGFFGRVSIGTPTQYDAGNWVVAAAYRYLQSDATVDAFTDSDFGLGGTNLKGYLIEGTYAIINNVWVGARWMSADQVSGPTYRCDVFQFDVWAKF
jgi:hypothetical protein